MFYEIKYAWLFDVMIHFVSQILWKISNYE